MRQERSTELQSKHCVGNTSVFFPPVCVTTAEKWQEKDGKRGLQLEKENQKQNKPKRFSHLRCIYFYCSGQSPLSEDGLCIQSSSKAK